MVEGGDRAELDSPKADEKRDCGNNEDRFRPPLFRPAREQKEERWEEKIELFLHRQRPGMQQDLIFGRVTEISGGSSFPCKEKVAGKESHGDHAFGECDQIFRS